MLGRIPVLALIAAVATTLVCVAPAQAAPPDVTAITSSPATIYPRIGTAQRPATTTITVESTTNDVSSLEVRDAADATVKTFDLTASDTTQWNGRDTGGNLVPAGSYTLIAFNGTEAAAVTGTVTVSLQHLVRKTYTVQTLPTKAYFKHVGRCSTLRKPSRRGWAGSYGYYANTRCGTQTAAASEVITVHAVRVPAAERYVDARIDTYGGAAKAQPGSRGGIDYWNNPGQTFVAFRFAGSKVGWHTGATTSATPLVDAQRFIAWRFYTAFKSQYDVAKFRVVVHYDVLSAS
ncbi:MAG TPA: FlgD immunoglobulin-like domain containing protein [Nocardioides sp.]|nr:FlgD immunoglobulin-like domain containing protein [Nocardioides sp.]